MGWKVQQGVQQWRKVWNESSYVKPQQYGWTRHAKPTKEQESGKVQHTGMHASGRTRERSGPGLCQTQQVGQQDPHTPPILSPAAAERLEGQSQQRGHRTNDVTVTLNCALSLSLCTVQPCSPICFVHRNIVADHSDDMTL